MAASASVMARALNQVLVMPDLMNVRITRGDSWALAS
jgi:hypothetical protein